MPLLRTCRLPFNIYREIQEELDKDSSVPLMSLPNLTNTNHLRTLTIGMHTSRFLERLLSCIPFIESLSIGVNDPWINEGDSFDINSLPAAIDGRHLLYLSRLSINCANNISFHRIIALLSSVFGQLTISHLSIKLEVFTLNSGPLIISGDIIQQLCIDRLKPSATYILNLLLYVQYDLEEKIIFNSFSKCPFTNRQQPRVFIQERDNFDIRHNYHCFMTWKNLVKRQLMQ
ncbi:unnamed protein product [Didymodactylos carnosus]|uniref:Uncharacterized protein n=1 Tax=Didymodactylos carnosus TaxID=1234261 RepID=A0A814XA55_9BILA|nr:unnamed protein product [Didymodactylos carnosus]CAF1308880.1 unnamed protein product [Didymodactylos carnosus]CAF3972676.1 unnamed protein product [Didymodactylos carnosus]CAF4116388.1 unnamed protein product [Didymodactylos carnosus]